MEDKFSLAIEDSAVNRIKKLQKVNAEKYWGLRILVEGGGCAGFQYAFDMISEQKKG